MSSQFRCQFFLLFLFIGASHLYGYLRCPHKCSGHGQCSIDNECLCLPGYYGPDCSQRSCPYDLAWADKAYELDTAHSLTECSNQGKCNRFNGKCQCFAGFDGIACQKSSCGVTKCSGRGACLTLQEIAQQNSFGSAQLSSYSPWEANHTTACVCQIGYSGPNCEYKLCPKGDDPVTPSTGFPTVLLTLTHPHGGTGLSGAFRLTFSGQTVLFPAKAAWTADECQASFQSLANIATVHCALTTDTTSLRVYTVQLRSFPRYPAENNLFFQDGQLDAAAVSTAFQCDSSLVVGAASCAVTSVSSTAILPEYTFCSNRGFCDFSTGVCDCFIDFTDAHCGVYSVGYRAYVAPPAENVLEVESKLLDYAASLIHIQTYVPGVETYNSFSVRDSDSTIFNMDGYGNIDMNYGGLTIVGTDDTGGAAVGSGGLTVTGGVSVVADGMTVRSDSYFSSTAQDGVFISQQGLAVSGGLSVRTGGLMVNDGVTVGSGGMVVTGGLISYSGGCTVALGGVSVTGGATVLSGGLMISKRGATVHSGGLVVESGGLMLNGINSGLILPNGFTIAGGGLAVTGGLTINSGGIKFLDTGGAGMSIAGGGLVMQNGLPQVMSGGLTSNGEIDVRTLGVAITGGLTVNQGGISVVSAGLFLTAGGATVNSVGIAVADGLTVQNAGVSVAGGLTVQDGSLAVVVGSAFVTPLGAAATGGLSVQNLGMVVAGGLTVRTEGLVVALGGASVTGTMVAAGGLTLSSGGQLLVTGGLTVGGGLNVAVKGLTVTNGGLVVTGGISVLDGVTAGGLTVASSGLRVTGGLTVLSMTVTSGGGTVRSDGLAVTGGLTVATGGLQSTGGLTVALNGIGVTGGFSVVSDGVVVQLGGVAITSSGGSVRDGLFVSDGLRVTGGLSVQRDGLLVITDGISLRNGMAVTGGLSVDSVVATNVGLTVTSGGFVVTSGITMTGGSGLAVAGRSSVDADGVLVSADGVSVTSDGATVTDGLIAWTLGAKVSGGLTVQDLGLVTPSVAINANGMGVTGGMTVMGDIVVASGVSVPSVGLMVVTGGIVVDTEGVVVLGGLTVAFDGLQLVGGMTVSTGGLAVTAGLTVLAGGVRVVGGGTVFTGGVTAPSLTVAGEGITLDSAFSVDSGGARVSGGVAVPGGGLSVTTKGLTVSQGGIKVSSAVASSVMGGVRASGLGVKMVQSEGVVTTDLRSYSNTVWMNTTSIAYSDRRLKTDIEVLEGAMDSLAQLTAVLYNWKQSDESGAVATKRHVGYLAQEVQKVLPDLVQAFDSEGHLGVRYDDLIPYLIEAIRAIDLRSQAVKARKADKVRKGKGCACRAAMVAEIENLYEEVERLQAEERLLTSLVEQKEASSRIG